MKALKEKLMDSNAGYAAVFGKNAELSSIPAKKLAILTCMDCRLDPAEFSGLSLGDAHVIRNAGGRASDDAIRSLVISHKLLGTDQWFVIHHTDCGMEMIDNSNMGELLSESLGTAILDREGWKNLQRDGGSEEGKFINWLPITHQRNSILEDVKRIREHPLVSEKISVYGFLFDVKTGRLEEIKD